MKKYLALLITLLLLFTGCARVNNEDAQPETMLDSQEMPKDDGAQASKEPDSAQNTSVKEEKEESTESDVPAVSKKITPSLKEYKNQPKEEETFAEFASLFARLNLEEHIVFRGIKTQEFKNYFDSSREWFPIEIKVLEPIYGDIQSQELITFREILGKDRDGDDFIVNVISDRVESIEDEKEYIFILKKTVEADGTVNYDYVSLAHTYTKLEDAEALAAKAAKGNATQIEKFRHTVLTAYEKKDFRLDLQAEAAKLMDGIEQKATKEEILSALPAEQKTLFEKMIDQYGTK